jgi:hypothetical protein
MLIKFFKHKTAAHLVIGLEEKHHAPSRGAESLLTWEATTLTRCDACIVALLCIWSLSSTGCGRTSPAAAQSQPSLEELAKRVEALEALLPSQSHMMADVGYHFGNLWSAGRAQNWPLADFLLAETKSHLRWAVRRIPIRKDSKGQDVNLVNILEAFENSQLAQLKATIDGKDATAFERVYKETLTMCYSCHKASDKPYLRPQIPPEPDTKVINFDPNADWPL